MPNVNHTENIIELKDISYSYGDEKVLKNISLDVHRGDYLGIIGPNGGGKTTLLKIMLGLLEPESGSVKLFSQSLGYVPQKVARFDNNFPATVLEVVTMGRFGKKGLFRFLNRKDAEIVKESLNQVDMWQFRDRLIGDLSGGQQQRVFIARALATKPEIIFLDEPTVGVDIKTQEEFYNLLEKLNHDLNLTLILVSHDIDVIASEVTELACINENLIYHGAPTEFIKGNYIKNLYGKGLKQILHT